MKLSDYLKKILSAFVDTYVRLFVKTFGATITLTLISFTVILFLQKINSFSEAPAQKPLSLLSYFFYRYSNVKGYVLTDLSKTVYLFFVSFLSLGLCRLSHEEEKGESYINLNKLFSKIKIADIFLLIAALIIASAIDYSLLSTGNINSSSRLDTHLKHYIESIVFFLRIYTPIILFSLSIHRAYLGSFSKLNFNRFCLLLISFWIFNEFTYESFLFVRGYIFNLLLLPFPDQDLYLIESIFGLFLMASYIIGYHTAMTAPFAIFEEADNTPVGKSPIKNHTS